MNDSNKSLAPFSCQYSSQFPELLFKLKATLAISTYQAGKLVFISAKNEESLIQLPRNFEKPMGIALHPTKDKLALACKEEMVVFTNSAELAWHYPQSPKKYDALYMPRKTYHTGPLDIHDLSYGNNDQLFAVNTLFSCLISLNDDYNFTPYWKPSFIDALVSEDRCHLNGMAMYNGLPKYATAFNQGNTAQSWRDTVTSSGVIFDVTTDNVVIENLAMPHSPHIFNEKLYVLLSATGELIEIDTERGAYNVVKKIEGFVRGMSLHKDYLFIGTSKLRKNSSTFSKLNIAEKANKAGIVVIHLPTGSLAGEITYKTSLDEIYDIQVLPNVIRPNILNTMTSDYKAGLMIPNATYWAQNRGSVNE